ncbi:hypothetical protein EBI01_05910 [Marinomonas rhizomae]|uniref:AAA domain-containing protein n=1 Tax=Marinomonas rhizomae TaxID=491948 RepID=A0A366JBG7_9GAMM|nr:hypothetical protein [Marinomonas rhizomae]RBP84313.1 hypothetical protein DFP80_104216 [Marinomonas rhizomae]RNF74632.1 hypothetical protein EBI01_05910 [Marinomonas rhizomae]
MHINSVSAKILAGTEDGLKPFGFEYGFNPGLNILTGDNSSGKSTILSCMYYCLGMEQLMGSKGINALSPALHQVLNFEGHPCNVYESSCSLIITANNGKQYTLTRRIVSSDEITINEILIFDGITTTPKFVHSARDHGDQGFYQWLAEVNELEIFNVESFNGESTKPLYMQNVFSLAFIEQTKGWSDIFSMMPSFGIKDPRQKVVEYSLGLNSLELNMKLDQIKADKNQIKGEWKRIDNDLIYRAQATQLYLSIFDKNKPITDDKIEGIYAAELNNDGKEIKISQITKIIQKEIDDSDKRIELTDTSKDISKDLISTREKIKESLSTFISERNDASGLYDEEKVKLASFKSSLSSTINDIQGFQDVKKLSISRNWESLSTSKCPVCENSVENKKDAELSKETIEKSIAFLKSQKSTYEKYIEASESVLERYVSALAYYDKSIALKRTQLDSIHKDLNSPSSQSVRGELEIQAELKHRLNDIKQFNSYLKYAKSRMKNLSKQYFILDGEEKRLKGLVSTDEETILKFKRSFISLLDSFGYKSNGVKNITIRDQAPHRLMPIVFIEGQEPQYIRYVSSASDFVRSIWSYYLCLLEMGSLHPGFLLMDEPGQHQMRVDSMKELLSHSSKLGKQVILAISQDRDYDKKDVNISALIEGIEPSKIHMLHIEDKTYCISPTEIPTNDSGL